MSNTATFNTSQNLKLSKKLSFGEEVANSVTHAVGAIAMLVLLPITAVHANNGYGMTAAVGMSVFVISLFLMFLSSAIYHAMDYNSPHKMVLRIIDHSMIYIAIAGSYTPICVIPLRDTVGIPLLILVWAVAIAGMLIKAFWITCPKWFSSTIYIAMGWLCVLAMVPLVQPLPTAAFIWLVAGGVIYTIGGVIYALKLPLFNAKHQYFGSHEIFHVFVMAGSLCHYVTMFYIAKM